jgi:hypothetical protein
VFAFYGSGVKQAGTKGSTARPPTVILSVSKTFTMTEATNVPNRVNVRKITRRYFELYPSSLQAFK